MQITISRYENTASTTKFMLLAILTAILTMKEFIGGPGDIYPYVRRICRSLDGCPEPVGLVSKIVEHGIP